MKYLFVVYFLLINAGISFDQSKPKPTIKQSLPELQKLFTSSGLPYKIVNDSMAVIAYTGENIASYSVVIQKINDLYVIYSNLTEALAEKIDETKYKYLLQQNDPFFIIKIGMSSDNNNMYVRSDICKAGITAVMLTRIINTWLMLPILLPKI